MAYAVLSYPDLKENDWNLIQDYRKENDEWLYTVVKPHFSFVFPVFNIQVEDFIEEVVRLTDNVQQIDFSIRCSTINKDSFSDYFHALLVPDEGYSQIVKLHDKLYSGILKDNLRLDIDFIPHVGVGNSTDKFKCKKMVDEWNRHDFEINGTISTLTIVNFEDNQIADLNEIILKK